MKFFKSLFRKKSQNMEEPHAKPSDRDVEAGTPISPAAANRPVDQGGYSEPYRLLDATASSGGIVFWVRDVPKAKNMDFIVQSLAAEAQNLPAAFMQRFLEGSQNLRLKTLPCPKGGCELHIDLAR